MIYVLLFALFCRTLQAQEDPVPADTILKANNLSRAIEKLASDFNGEQLYGEHIGGGCVGAWKDYMELLVTWSRLTQEQEPGTLNVALVRVKAKAVEAVEALGDCLKLITEDFKKVRKATKNLPPK